MMHLNNGGFAYDGFFRYSGVSLYTVKRPYVCFIEKLNCFCMLFHIISAEIGFYVKWHYRNSLIVPFFIKANIMPLTIKKREKDEKKCEKRRIV